MKRNNGTVLILAWLGVLMAYLFFDTLTVYPIAGALMVRGLENDD